ncbi:hypothetical protein [Arthrospiribacter ruber]|uniref:Uncharacterized protein n=1 Tax=Arthrospiribacter ruber TaxID=2487934 RepID=A0A951IZQ8_9BACT|nr:hypothetical protein [Arthrospiribacter ruber]MBW3468348.1 hypothetical protein [Arthrospiribacter ruber]
MKRILSNFCLPLVLCLILTFLQSCTDDDVLPEVEESPAKFERYWNLQHSRGDFGNLKKINDRLYFSNVINPGFFDMEDNQHVLAAQEYDMKFGHSFSELFSAGVVQSRKTLLVMPNTNFMDNYTARLTPLNIPELPLEAQVKPGWFEVPNYAINDNFIISTWDRNIFESGMDLFDNTFILELNQATSSFGPYINPTDPIVRKIKIDLEIQGATRLDLISAFTHKDGWLVSGCIGGICSSFFITKEGNATPIRSLDERFVVFSFIEGPNGDSFLSTEGMIFYSNNGDIYNFEQVAYSNQWHRLKFIDDRLITWVGTDKIYELKNYTDPENIEAVELINEGLEGLWVKDIELFNNRIFVSTNAGLFLKDLEDLWVYKEDVNGELSKSSEISPVSDGQ